MTHTPCLHPHPPPLPISPCVKGGGIICSAELHCCQDNIFNNIHKQTWIVSFHVSKFPGPTNLLHSRTQNRNTLIPSMIIGCRVEVSPTDVSPTENSWMLRLLNKASLGYCVPDQCFPTLDRVKHGTSSVGRYRGLGRPLAPNESVGRLASFTYAPDQVY